MFIIQFLEPVDNDFVGPFASEAAANIWLEEMDRREEHVIHSLTDPATEMFGLWRR